MFSVKISQIIANYQLFTIFAFSMKTFLNEKNVFLHIIFNVYS